MQFLMDIMCILIKMIDGVSRNKNVQFREPLNVTVVRGEHVAIIGNNGAGKSLLADTLLGYYPLCKGGVKYGFSSFPSDNLVYKNVQYISFRDIYGSSEANYCYQLRWNIHEQDGIPTVRHILGNDIDKEENRLLLSSFAIDTLLDELVVALSSGELRKLQIVKALFEKPSLLVLDNPFIGLDVEARCMLVDLLSSLAVDKKIQMMLLLSSCKEIPPFINKVIFVDSMSLRGEYKLNDFRCNKVEPDTAALRKSILSLPDNVTASSGAILKFNDITVKYGNRTILRNLSWCVRRGDVWLLRGANGSGKSTLLSLVCADNLQSYACDITLFGRKRGTGESIWDIKKRIGYVSPEMHRSYLRNLPIKEIVASGLFDTIGLYRRPSASQIDACRFWMDIFGIGELADSSFMRVSSGEQRLALLARAFVKDPELLILDEPMHGLDDYNKARVKAAIEAFSLRKGKSVIFVSHYDEDVPSTVTNTLELRKEL